MIDYILFGLISGLIVFFSLFFVSFVTLGLIAGVIRLIALVFSGFGLSRASTFREQTA
jgi:hypothetical protein